MYSETTTTVLEKEGSERNKSLSLVLFNILLRGYIMMIAFIT